LMPVAGQRNTAPVTFLGHLPSAPRRRQRKTPVASAVRSSRKPHATPCTWTVGPISGQASMACRQEKKAAPRLRSTWEPWVTVGGGAYLQQPSAQQAWPVLEGWAQDAAAFAGALALVLASAGKQQEGSQPISMQHWMHSQQQPSSSQQAMHSG